MIDLKALRENPQPFREAAQLKNKDIDFDRIIALDKQSRSLQQEFQTIAAQKNAASAEIAKAEGDDRTNRIAEMQEIGKHADTLRDQLVPIQDELQEMLYRIPNLMTDDVPVGKDDTENVEMRRHGDIPAFDFEPKDHIELGILHNMIDTEKAAQVSGARFAYIKNGAAHLQLAIMQFVVATVTNERILKEIIADAGLNVPSTPFQFVFPPMMIKPEPYKRMARLSEEVEAERYYLEADNMYLIGSAEHTLGPMHMDEILKKEDLPIRYLGYSSAFRREAGSYGKDTRGIIRQHQFDKLEFECFTDQESSIDEQNFLVAIQEYLVRKLEIPYRAVMVCTGDIGTPDARQIDIECWIPTQKTYRETHSADLMTDYQSRRLNTRYKDNEGIVELVHMNDATAFAIGRILVALIENHQKVDGSITIPEALVPHMGGLTALIPKK